MQKLVTHKPKQMVHRVIAKQVVVTLIAAAIVFAFFGLHVAKSVLLAGIVVVLVNSIFAFFVFRGDEIQPVSKVMGRFVTGEALKLFLSAALIAFVIAKLNVSPIAFLVAFLVLQTLVWFMGTMNRSVQSP